MLPHVAIIILNWNGWKDTIECLESLYQITYPNYTVILVDNGSEDESIEKIKAYCDGKIEVQSKFFEYNPRNKPIKIIEYSKDEAEARGGREDEISSLPSNRKIILIKNEKNYGFAEGNNIGLRYILKKMNASYSLLLNNDIVVDKKFLFELTNAIQKKEKIGGIGSKIYVYNEPKKLHAVYSKIYFGGGRAFVFGQNAVDIGQYENEKETDFVFGECFFISNDALIDVGLFNPNYFVYWEEIELCIRLKRKGYKLRFCPKAKIWHKVHSTSNKIIGFKEYYQTRNCIWTVKNYGNLDQKILFVPYYFFLTILRIINEPMILRNKQQRDALLKGIIDGIFKSA